MMGTTSPSSSVAQEVGHGFRPTEEELVNHHLKHKLSDNNYTSSKIPEVYIYDFEPWELADLWAEYSGIKSNQEYHFFCPHRNKFANSNLKNRTTNTGNWKITGNSRKIKSEADDVIGVKRIMTYKSHSLNTVAGTNWVIHEYSNTTFDVPNKEAFVLCKLMKGKNSCKKLATKAKTPYKMPKQKAKIQYRKARKVNYNEGQMNSTGASDSETRNLNEKMTDLSTSNEGEPSCNDKMIAAADCGDANQQLSCQMIADCIASSSSEKGERTDDLENHIANLKISELDKLPFEKGKIIALDEDEEQNTNEKTDISTYNKGEEEQKTDDNGEADWLATFASENYVEDTFLEQTNHEMLPSYLQSSPGYNQQDYSFDLSPHQVEIPTEQVQGTSFPEEDWFSELEPLWAWDNNPIRTYPYQKKVADESISNKLGSNRK